MVRVRTILLMSVILAAGCRADAGQPAAQRSEPVAHTEVTPGTERDIRPIESASYARTLEQQLDLVPPDADAYLVIRDLRPLIAQARRIEQVLAGPVARAIPALAKLGGGTGDARLAQLGRTRELLAVLLAGLENAGLELDKGAVLVQGQGEPLVLFAAPNLERLGVLADLAGVSLDLAGSCGALADQPGWFACSLGGAADLGRYQPANQGAALAKRLGDRLGGVELERVNLAVSLAEPDGSIDAVLRTDPGLWELSVPVPLPAGQDLLTVGAAPGLRALVPGTSFMWARVNPSLLVGGAERSGPLDPELLTGELWFGAIDRPNGFVAQAGITDASAVAKTLQVLAVMLPDKPLTPAQLDGVSFEFDRASIDLDGKLVPSIGSSMSGESAAAWAETLGVAPRGRVWAYADYLSLGLGEIQAIPAALAKLEGTGPSPEAIAGLPPSLARALLAGEVGLVMHLVLDHWQAPPSEAELASLLAGVAADRRPEASEIAALFQALAPWSSVDLWLRKRGEQWIANVSLVPFAAPAEGVGADETEAAGMVLDTVLAGPHDDHGEAGQAGYRELLARYPGSPWAYAYRARSGQAPQHHATVGMVELGLVGALVVPALDVYIDKAKSSEASRETQAILVAALAVREQTGSCDSLVGTTGPTPALTVRCHAGEGGRCRPSSEPNPDPELGEYPSAAWSEQPIWSALEYRPDRFGTGSHRFHYEFTAELGPKGCQLRVRAQGDLDGDGLFSTYAREATIADDGSQSLLPMQVDEGEE